MRHAMPSYLDVTDKNAILKAIAEFDSLGRDEFLKTYGFRHARSFFILHYGNQYDCKPILWAAYKHQFGELLLARASSWVNRTVRPKLEGMGFVVISTETSLEDIEDELSRKVNESLNRSSQERQKRLFSAEIFPQKTKIITMAYIRNPDVIAEVLTRAKGTCEARRCVAPFNRASNGTPYLEVHHKVRLADGGEDTIENAIALCPNCHREKHYG